MRKPSLAPLLLTLPLALPAAAAADIPAFDRPGTGFAVTTLPARTFAWEQGLPDMSRDKRADITESVYRADAVIRAGLIDNLELQVSHAPYNYRRMTGPGRTREAEGASGTGISLKYALPDLSETLSWAVLGGTTVDIGNEPFSPDGTVYTLGTTVEWAWRNDRSLSTYLNVDKGGGDSIITVSPTYSVAVSDCADIYAELIYIRADGQPQYLFGSGIAWMATDIVQLDLYANLGLNADSNDLEAGIGFSIFIQ